MNREPTKAPPPRKGMPSPRLNETEFKMRYRERFFDPAFRPYDAAINEIAEVAWQAYLDSRKSPITRKAGSEFADSDYDLSVDWLAARDAVLETKKDTRMRRCCRRSS